MEILNWPLIIFPKTLLTSVFPQLCCMFPHPSFFIYLSKPMYNYK